MKKAKSAKQALKSKKDSKPRLSPKEILLRTSLLAIFVVLIASSLFRGFNLIEFYKIATGKADRNSQLREYACRTPESVGGEIELEHASKSFDNQRLNDANLTINLQPNGNLLDVDPGVADRPKHFQSSYYGAIDAKYRYDRNAADSSQPFVRVDVASSQQGAGASWIPEPYDLKGQNGFLYVVDYRSDAVSYITLELTGADGKLVYEPLGTLSATQTWKNFRARFIVPSDTVRVRAYVVLTAKGYLETRNYKLYELPNKLDKGVVSVNFDDGWKSVYTEALPLLDKHGVKTTQYIVGSYLADGKSYMSTSEVQDMQRRGHEIGSHSLKHCDLAKLSEDELEYDTETNQSILEKRFGDIPGMAYPFGSYNQRTNILMEKHYKYTRSTEPGYNDFYFDPYNIKVRNIRANTTLAEIQGWIEFAKKEKLWLVLVYHQVEQGGEFGVTPQNFDTHLELIKSSGIEVKTIQEMIDYVEDLDEATQN